MQRGVAARDEDDAGPAHGTRADTMRGFEGGSKSATAIGSVASPQIGGEFPGATTRPGGAPFRDAAA